MDKARARAGEVVKAQSDGFAQIVAPTILALQQSGMSYREIATKKSNRYNYTRGGHGMLQQFVTSLKD